MEQDLVICRALCDLFNASQLSGKIAFRGGTAINKLLFDRPLRYSEDIDLVQTRPEPIGPTVDGVRDALSWLGKCQREQAGHSMHLVFKFSPEVDAQTKMKLKVEINTREHQSLLGHRPYPFSIQSDWYIAEASVVSFEPEEIFATKLRALLQRRKNRDLFDLHHGLAKLDLNVDRLIACFDHYLALEGHPITRAEAEKRMLEKLTRSLTEDVEPLLPAGLRFDAAGALAAFEHVWTALIIHIKGDPWKLTEKGHRQTAAEGLSESAQQPLTGRCRAAEAWLPSRTHHAAAPARIRDVTTLGDLLIKIPEGDSARSITEVDRRCRFGHQKSWPCSTASSWTSRARKTLACCARSCGGTTVAGPRARGAVYGSVALVSTGKRCGRRRPSMAMCGR